MTVAPQYTRPKKRKTPPKPKRLAANRKSIVGWPEWAVPTKHLADFIMNHEQLLQAEYTPLPTQTRRFDRTLSITTANNECGWRELLAMRLALRLHITDENARRRIYEITTTRTHVTGAKYAEAICYAVGKQLDADTDIPTFPGTFAAAEELVEMRAEEAGVKLDELEARRLARKTLRICWLIIAYPHNTERLLDLAPFNCLRRYER